MTLEEAFGRVLRQIRQEQKISQEKLGFESGYHRTYIGLLERGKKSPSLATIFTLANTLSIKASTMIGRVEELIGPDLQDPERQKE